MLISQILAKSGLCPSAAPCSYEIHMSWHYQMNPRNRAQLPEQSRFSPHHVNFFSFGQQSIAAVTKQAIAETVVQDNP